MKITKSVQGGPLLVMNYHLYKWPYKWGTVVISPLITGIFFYDFVPVSHLAGLRNNHGKSRKWILALLSK